MCTIDLSNQTNWKIQPNNRYWDAVYGNLENVRNFLNANFKSFTGVDCPRLYTSRCGSTGTVTIPLSPTMCDDSVKEGIHKMAVYVCENIPSLSMNYKIEGKDGQLLKRPKAFLKLNFTTSKDIDIFNVNRSLV